MKRFLLNNSYLCHVANSNGHNLGSVWLYSVKVNLDNSFENRNRLGTFSFGVVIYVSKHIQPKV